MAITLPFPVRVAVGILATGLDRVRSLPEDIPAIPVALVGNALKLSMKVQQEIATLATRGDEVLGGVVNAPQENPSWAKFDDDEPAPPVAKPKPASRPAAKPAAGKPTAAKPAPAKPGASGSPAGAPAKAPVNTPPDLIGGPSDAPGLTTPEASSMAPVTTTAMDAAIDVADELVELATLGAADEAPVDPTDGSQRIRAAHDALDIEEAASLGAFEAGQVPADVLDSVVIGETDELTAGLQVPADVIEDVLVEAEIAETEAVLEEIAEVEAVEELLEEAAELEAVEELLEEAAEIQAADELTAPTVFESAEVLSDVEDEPLEPVVFGETADLTEGLPISDELIEEVAEEAQQADDDGPSALPGYDSMTLAQVRGHLRELTPADVSELLAYEQSGDNRAPFLTLLSNRLVTLDAQNS
ncbi:MAG: hypothetical protein ABWZ98_07345 [Nakamurella sp.]